MTDQPDDDTIHPTADQLLALAARAAISLSHISITLYDTQVEIGGPDDDLLLACEHTFTGPAALADFLGIHTDAVQDRR
ncbi:hypothetical protein [Streptomyces sp. HPF1205]|uniref:hypothetical protein n=1 Tax=Streptomyces sp. HPF1205 TaxID=2873262 RepID=UPI001CECDF7E|nr:hypothetical protein [Streptomyces sp. HPF1205]